MFMLCILMSWDLGGTLNNILLLEIRILASGKHPPIQTQRGEKTEQEANISEIPQLACTWLY